MKQPIYGISLQAVYDAIDEATDKYMSGYDFGESNPKSIKEYFRKLFDSKGVLETSIVINNLKKFETGKMPAYANAAIHRVVRSINAGRVIINSTEE